ncbi:MAG: hypothetical protein JO099_20845 [Acidobacteriia bacterium]|nr:hypothetical protein [Terriglobia bacterium]
MKRALRLGVLLGIGFVFSSFAQEAEKQGESGGQEIWLTANFVILALGLGFLIAKNAGPFFAARAQKIQQEIAQGEAARQDAERRSAEVDRRLANLDAEIASLRAESQTDIETERERMRQRIASERARITASAQQEIEAAGKTARAELKRYSAELAIGLAERKIRSRINPETQDALIGSFVEMLNQQRPDGGPTLRA